MCVLLCVSDPNIPQSSYQSEMGQAPVMFPGDPNSPMPVPTQMQGAPFPGIYQAAPSQPSPFDPSQLPPGVSPVPNGVSPGVLVGIPLTSNAAPESVMIPQSVPVESQPSIYQGSEDSFRVQVCGFIFTDKHHSLYS